MNDEILIAQFEKTGNLLDVLNDDAWRQETDVIEAKCGGQVEAGLALKPYVEQLATVPPEAFRHQRRRVQMLSILLPELKAWLQSWGLGLSLEVVYIEAQRRLFERLQQPTPKQATCLEALLTKDAQRLESEQKTGRRQAIALLASLFTEDDWQAFAQTAAEETAKGILQVRQREVVQSGAS